MILRRSAVSRDRSSPIRRAASCQNPVYPGQKPVALSTEKPLVLRYRIVLHRDGFDAVRMKKFFEGYEGTVK